MNFVDSRSKCGSSCVDGELLKPVKCLSASFNTVVTHPESLVIGKLSFSQIKSWVALSFVLCLSVRPACVTSPQYDVLDHTNHTFSESSWYQLSTNPLSTHTSSTQVTDPPNPLRTHLTWPFLHFMTFYTIQTKYFLKPHDNQYPLTHWPLTHHLHRPTKPTIWPSESRTVYSV